MLHLQEHKKAETPAEYLAVLGRELSDKHNHAEVSEDLWKDSLDRRVLCVKLLDRSLLHIFDFEDNWKVKSKEILGKCNFDTHPRARGRTF